MAAVDAVERRALMRSEMCALLKTDHALNRAAAHDESSVQVAALVGESLLLPHAGGEWLAGISRGDDGRAGVRHFLSDAVTMLAAAREGWGIALLPRCVLDGLNLSGLTVKSITPALEWELHLAARSWSLAPRPAQAFAEITQTWIAANSSPAHNPPS